MEIWLDRNVEWTYCLENEAVAHALNHGWSHWIISEPAILRFYRKAQEAISTINMTEGLAGHVNRNMKRRRIQLTVDEVLGLTHGRSNPMVRTVQDDKTDVVCDHICQRMMGALWNDSWRSPGIMGTLSLVISEYKVLFVPAQAINITAILIQKRKRMYSLQSLQK